MAKDFLGKQITEGDTIVYSTCEGRALVLARVVRVESYGGKPRVVVNRYREGDRTPGDGWYAIDPKREVRLTELKRVLVLNDVSVYA